MLSASRAREGEPASANRAYKTGEWLPISFSESAPDASSESTKNTQPTHIAYQARNAKHITWMPSNNPPIAVL